MVIALIGYMGAGKSTIGGELSFILGVPLIDLDDFIEKKEGKKISEIFQKKGEIYFRKKEKEYLNLFFKEYKDAVLSTGGGTPVFYDNLENINRNSFSVYLRATPSTLSNRLISQKENRPLIAHLKEEELPEFIAKHLFERNVFYEKADCVVPTDGKKIDEVVDEILKVTKNHQNHS